MTTQHSGNIQPQLDLEEHVPTANAKRVAIVVQDANSSSYIALTALDLSSGNPLLVTLADPTTGAALAVRNPTSFYVGSLTSTETTVYLVPSGKKAKVTQIRVRNTGSSTRTVTAGVREASIGASYNVWVATLAAGEAADFLEGEMGLSEGDQLRMKQDAGIDVHVVATGEELS